MMKKLLLLSSLCIFGVAQGQQANFKVGVGEFNPHRSFPATNVPNSLMTGATDTLHYFFNKHYFRNSQFVVPPQTGPENNLFFTIPTPYSTTLQVTHFGSVFNNSVSLAVTGLEGIAAFEANSTSTAVPVTMIIATLNAQQMPVLPGLDSITTMLDANLSGAWIGGNFNTPVNVTGRFAVLIKIGNGAAAGDTISPFMNNASTPTSTAPTRHKYGEGLGRIRYGGNWNTTAGGFGGGADYEFLVAPRVMFNYDAGITVNTPTICTNSSGSFSNASLPVGIIEHKQFNFNAFYKAWYPWALSTNSLILNRQVDSIFDWTFTGASPAQSYAKNPSVTFNTNGTQTAALDVKYKPSAQTGIYASYSDPETANIVVTNNAAPVLAIAGPTAVCSGASTTLTASGSTTYTWTNPPSQSSSVVVNPTQSTTYTVSSSNGGCIGSQTLFLIVNPAPTVAVTTPTGACVNSLFTLTATGANAYSWNNGTTTNTNAVSSTSAGIASFTVTGTNDGCPASVVVANVTINDRPTVSLFADDNFACSKAQGGLPITLSGDPSTGGTGVYSGQGVSAGKFTPNNTGTFTATYSFTDAATGCSKQATTSIIVSPCTGLSSNALNSSVSIYPNPAVNGRVTIANLEGSNVIAVYNILGALVVKEVVSKSEYQLDLAGQAEGTYFMRITDANAGVKTVKIVNQK
jgi:hypothetical protein